MKLRTSLFNPAAFKKDITRFAPAWVLYTVGLFMVLTVCVIDTDDYFAASNLAESVSFMAGINLCYGLLNGQLLFGDLFSARHCNALHAMPLRRECWFVTHIVSGLLFALVPNLLMSLIALPILGAGWSVALWWLLAVMLQYLFFFGLAVCSALCVGNRFAMVLVYGIVNFFSLIVYWFYYSIYEPLLYGVFIREDPFTTFCPVWIMVENYELIDVRSDPNAAFFVIKSVTTGEGWEYLAICAAIGAALMGIALLLYRSRKLESAGDFMAVRALEPVFLVLYTLSMAAFFQMFTELFGGDEYIFLALGLLIGFFTGRMLLMRTTRVFQPKAFLWFGILAVVFIASMVLTWLDPIGITRYIPDADDVAQVKLSTSYNPEYGEEPCLTDEADIETVRQIHQLVLDGQIGGTSEKDEDYYSNLSLYYVLDSGVTITRKYQVACTSPAGQLMGEFQTRPDYVLGTDDVNAFMAGLQSIYMGQYQTADGAENYLETAVYDGNEAAIRGLVEAILADCAEGTMAQMYGYHDGDEERYWIQFECRMVNNMYDYTHITIYESNCHTIEYLEKTEIPVLEKPYG